MKPLLIIPPAPTRWPALRELLGHKGPLWLEDIEKRLCEGVVGGQDALAIFVNGGEVLANVCINRQGGIGVLGHTFTRRDHRRRGLATKLLRTALEWFDMTGGKWLYLGCHAELVELYAKCGFKVAHRVTREPIDDVMMMRKAAGVAGDTPLPDGNGDVEIRDVTRADWPLIVALLQDRPGADPRVPLAESAVTAELTGLELLSQQEQGKCHLLAATRAGQITGLASMATAHGTPNTYAMILPHDQAPPRLREAVIADAKARNYVKVEFPMEALGGS